jgi:SynChlorMet cassette radical SAM/SPASM protein ScmF
MGCEPELNQNKSRAAKPCKVDLPSGVPPLTSLYMYIAGSCNLACRHCWIEPDYQASNKNGKFVKMAHLKKAIRQAKPLGLGSVKLTGGEPMLHPEFREIVNYVESQKIGMILETNGILIDDGMARFLKAKKHFNFISVSLDGAKAATHDWLRGVKGSYKQAISGIKSLVKAGFKPQMICTLHKSNVAELEDVVKLAQRLGCGSVKFNHVQHMGRSDRFAEKNGFKVKKLIHLFQKIESKIQPKYNIPIHFDIPAAFFPKKKLLHSSIPCCHLLNILGILSTGDMSICGVGVTIPELNFGNLANDDLAKVWAKASKLRELRRVIPDQFEGVCGRCIHKFTCLGACIANNYHLKKKFNSPYYFCDEALRQGLFPFSRLQ